VSADPNAQVNGSKALWVIGQVSDRPVIGTSGTYVDGKDIEVIFWDGSIEHLLYPKSAYSPATVAQAAQKAAETHLQVKALQGPMVPPDVIAY
jgi:hypothetical protein